MSDKNTARLAWAWCMLTLVGAILVAAFDLRARPAGDTVLKTVGSMALLVAFAAFALTGALIISRQSRNMVGWLLMIEGSVVFIWPLDPYFSGLAQGPVNPSFLTYVGIWINFWGWLLAIFPIFLILLHFPTGKPPSRRWRWVVFLGLGLCAFFLLYATFMTELFSPTDDSWSVPNPIGFLSKDSFPYPVWVALLFAFVISCVASLFIRYRRAKSSEREQIKWLLYVAALFVLVYAISFVSNSLPDVVNDLVSLITSFAILLLPAAIAIAILRYRLYDIDVIIRKTVVYAVLTGLLGLVYFGVIVVLQSIFETVSGEQSPITIVVSTLIIAALFGTLRRRVQDFIDRRFYRRRYDAEKTLTAFAQFVRDETDLEALTAELQRVVKDTMQPNMALLWLKPVADRQHEPALIKS
jgi:MFS family permease